jgi:hypothetical protein
MYPESAQHIPLNRPVWTDGTPFIVAADTIIMERNKVTESNKREKLGKWGKGDAGLHI